MNIKPLINNLIIPTKSTQGSVGFDVYMPTPGWIDNEARVIDLGFAAAVPEGYMALILPRSGVGSREGLELNNTCGVIDSDYRGEWKASLRLKGQSGVYTWNAGDRLLQFIIIPVSNPVLCVVNNLDDTARGQGGLGSTGI